MMNVSGKWDDRTNWQFYGGQMRGGDWEEIRCHPLGTKVISQLLLSSVNGSNRKMSKDLMCGKINVLIVIHSRHRSSSIHVLMWASVSGLDAYCPHTDSNSSMYTWIMLTCLWAFFAVCHRVLGAEKLDGWTCGFLSVFLLQWPCSPPFTKHLGVRPARRSWPDPAFCLTVCMKKCLCSTLHHVQL